MACQACSEWSICEPCWQWREVVKAAVLETMLSIPAFDDVVHEEFNGIWVYDYPNYSKRADIRLVMFFMGCTKKVAKAAYDMQDVYDNPVLNAIIHLMIIHLKK
jgi:hypothetical protein